MERSTKHRIGQLLVALGFLSVVFGGLGLGFLTLDTRLFAGIAGVGFLVFVLGAEIALRTRKHVHES